MTNISSYPEDYQEFLNGTNNAKSTLVTAINDTDLTIVLTDGSLFPETNFVITIDSEIILCTSRTGNTITASTRGFESTTAATHLVGIEVNNYFTAYTYTLLNDTLEEVQRQAIYYRSVVQSVSNDPPALPTLGDQYIVDSVPTGVWVTHENDIARWDGTEWLYTIAVHGYITYNLDEDAFIKFDGTDWSGLGSYDFIAPLDETDGTVTIAPVTSTTDGSMISTDKVKLDEITDTGSGEIITNGERTNYDTAYAHTFLTDNPHSVTADQLEVEQLKNGFDDRTYSSLSFVDATRTFTISDLTGGTGYKVYSDNNQFIKTADESIVINDAEGLHFIYFDETGTLMDVDNFNTSLIIRYCLISIIYWDFDNKKHVYMGDERHGYLMDSETHLNNHVQHGTTYYSGGDLGDLVIDGNTSADNYMSFSATNILDEDINIAADAKIASGNLPVFYSDGGNWRVVGDTDPFATYNANDTGTAYYNDPLVAGGLVRLASNRYVLAHIVFTNDPEKPFISVMGQETYVSSAAARSGAEVEINTLLLDGLPFVEFVFAYTVIFQSNTAYVSTSSTIARASEDGDYVDWRFSKLTGGGGSGVDTTGKMDKIPTATEDNIVAFDSLGNSKDSGYNLDGLQISHHDSNITTTLDNTWYDIPQFGGTSLALATNEVAFVSSMFVANTALNAQSWTYENKTVLNSISVLNESKNIYYESDAAYDFRVTLDGAGNIIPQVRRVGGSIYTINVVVNLTINKAGI